MTCASNLLALESWGPSRPAAPPAARVITGLLSRTRARSPCCLFHCEAPVNRGCTDSADAVRQKNASDHVLSCCPGPAPHRLGFEGDTGPRPDPARKATSPRPRPLAASSAPHPQALTGSTPRGPAPTGPHKLRPKVFTGSTLTAPPSNGEGELEGEQGAETRRGWLDRRKKDKGPRGSEVSCWGQTLDGACEPVPGTVQGRLCAPARQPCNPPRTPCLWQGCSRR